MNPSGLREKVVIILALRPGLAAPRQSGLRAKVARVAWDVNDAAQSEVIRELDAAGKCYFASLTSPMQDVDDGVGKIIRQWGRVDILVNNAGITRDAQLIK